jgi:hypothetical protein
MKPRRRRLSLAKRPSRWTANDWERAWGVAAIRIAGIPTCLEKKAAFQESLTVLNAAFAQGDGLRFEMGLIALLDFCAEAINRGECEQWW